MHASVERKGGSLASKPIRAVTFDVGGTLIECWPSVGHVYADVAAQNGYPKLSPTVLNRQFKTAWREFKRFKHTTADWAALVDATFNGLVQPLPSRGFFPELYNRFSDPEAWHIFADVVPVLKNLKARGVLLAVISNWDDRLRPLLHRLKLDSYFETILVSCEVGAHKPARKIFASAYSTLKLSPSEILHVGDSLDMDFRGALEAGLQARWLRRGIKRRTKGTILSLLEII